MAHQSRGVACSRQLSYEEIEARRCLSSAPTAILPTDLDGDGDIDVLYASSGEGMAWLENTDGDGSFSTYENKRFGCNAVSVSAADMDGDGDVDVFCSATRLVVYENTDGKERFVERQVIDTGQNQRQRIFAADVDSDGDVDLLSPPSWYENRDGRGTFDGPKAITMVARVSTPLRNAADIDGDGDMDFVSASLADDKIAWYENMDGEGSLGEPRVITTQVERANSVFAADIDGDGDMDVLSASQGDRNLVFSQEGRKIAWYQNIDGSGRFGEQHVITMNPTVWPFSSALMSPADVDGDGDIDVLALGGYGTVAWYKNDSPHVAAGDANRDLQFDQQDIVAVVKTAKYMTGESATFAEGDWNDDGLFDQLDIVAALQTGNYLQGPYAQRTTDALFAEIAGNFP